MSLYFFHSNLFFGTINKAQFACIKKELTTKFVYPIKIIIEHMLNLSVSLLTINFLLEFLPNIGWWIGCDFIVPICDVFFIFVSCCRIDGTPFGIWTECTANFVSPCVTFLYHHSMKRPNRYLNESKCGYCPTNCCTEKDRFLFKRRFFKLKFDLRKIYRKQWLDRDDLYI